MLESIGYAVVDIREKISPERLERIEYRVTEIDKAMSGLTLLGVLVVGLLGLILWRIW